MGKSKIQWTERTLNPIIGCSHCSPGCDNCFAERAANVRAGNPKTPQYKNVIGPDGKWNGTTRLVESALAEPLRRKKPSLYFVGSMGDLFHESVPFEWIDTVFAAMAACPQHRFLLLTKRADRLRNYWKTQKLIRPVAWPRPNIGLGVTVCTQQEADEKLPVFLDITAPFRYVSYEPAIEAVDFFSGPYYGPFDLIICGGETGPNARPMHPDWARQTRDGCKLAGVHFIFKQWGEWIPKSQCKANLSNKTQWGVVTGTGYYFDQTTPWNGHDDDGSGEAVVYRVGHKRAGNVLDGKTYTEWHPWMRGG